jgi:hypothetical protein
MTIADDLLYAPVNNTPVSTPSNGSVAAATTTDMKLPRSWLDVITRIRSQSGWEETALAGGCLRDLDLGRPIKDVDIFLPVILSPPPFDILKNLFRGVFVDEIVHVPGQNSAVSNGIQVLSHYQFRINGWRFEITQKAEPFTALNIIDSFDLGFCMICLDRNNQVYRSPEYLKDAAHQTITIVRQTGGREREHAQRLQDLKYPNWGIF